MDKLKVYVYDERVLFKVLMKSGTDFRHFAWTAASEMMTRGILCSKGIVFNLNPTHYHFLRNFEWKCEDTEAELDNTKQKATRDTVMYSTL